MTGGQALLALRLVEIVFMTGCFAWLVWGFPPSRLRNIRLSLALFLIVLNLTAIIVAVAVLKVRLW